MITRYDIQRAMPTILTVTACTGVVGTELLAFRAGYRYKKKVDEGEAPIPTAIKEGIWPTLAAAASITSFIFAGNAYKEMIAGLSLAASSGLNRVVEEHYTQKTSAKTINAPHDTIVIEEDGELFYEPIADTYIQMTTLTYVDGMNKLNKNYAIRGICSVYEMYRMFGVRKNDIYDRGIDWIKFVGWHVTPMYEGKGFTWVDNSAPYDEYRECRIIAVEDDLQPICCDANQFILDKCNMDEKDLEEYKFELPEAAEVEYRIANDIMDEVAE